MDLSFIDNFDFESFTFDEELEQLIDEVKPKVSQKNLEDIIVQHEKTFKDALLTGDFAVVEKSGFVLADNAVDKPQKLRDRLTKDFLLLVNRAALVYAFVYGNYTIQRTWFRVQDDLYVRLKSLNSIGNRGVLTTVFRRQIAGLLDKGKNNAMLSVLDRAGIKIHENKRKFCFPKGHFLVDGKPHADEIAKDLRTIFEEISKNAPERDFKKLRFLNEKPL